MRVVRRKINKKKESDFKEIAIEDKLLIEVTV